MVSSLWLGVMGSLLVSALGVLIAIWLFARGNRLAVERTAGLLKDLGELLTGAQQDASKTDDRTEEEQKAFEEFWKGIADIFIARFKEKDGKTAGGIISSKATEARTLMDALKFVKENKNNPDAIKDFIFGGGTI